MADLDSYYRPPNFETKGQSVPVDRVCTAVNALPIWGGSLAMAPDGQLAVIAIGLPQSPNGSSGAWLRNEI